MTDTSADARRVQRVLDEVTEDAETPAVPDPFPDRSRLFQTVGFSRMKERWTSEEQTIISAAREQAENELMMHFSEFYLFLNGLYEIVREKKTTSSGLPMTDRYGYPEWKRDEFGMFVEDWSKLTERDKEHFLYGITTRLVIWEQQAGAFWGEAMFAKAQWEERFALAFREAPFTEGKRPTEADRREYSQIHSREDRYFSLYLSMRSRQAQDLVRSMERLAQRVKDTIR
jgi:hypothetical protein